jgi:hypothetical protein
MVAVCSGVGQQTAGGFSAPANALLTQIIAAGVQLV